MTSSLKDLTKRTNSVRKELNKLTNSSVDGDQSTGHFKSFAHLETSSEEICGTIEALMNANCSKFAADKTIQKICSSGSSKDIDVTLNHLSMSEGPEDDDPRNMTASMLHTTGTPHQTMMQPQSEFSLKFLPPSRSESERELRQLIDQCVEEKEQVETALSTLEKCLVKIKENQEKIESMKKEERKGGKGEKGDGESAAVKAKIKKFEKEIQALKKKEKEREKEEIVLRKKMKEFEGEEDNKENTMREEDGERRTKEQLENRLEIVEELTAWPFKEERPLKES